MSCELKDGSALEGRVNLSPDERSIIARRGLGLPRFGLVWLAGPQGRFVLPRGVGDQRERRARGAFDAPTDRRLPVSNTAGSFDAGTAIARRLPGVDK